MSNEKILIVDDHNEIINSPAITNIESAFSTNITNVTVILIGFIVIIR